MRGIVIYFSQTGNTEMAAKIIADNLGLDAVKINNDGSTDPNFDPNGFSDFIIGYPIWNGKVPEAFLDYLSSINWAGRRIYHFCTMGGYLGVIDSQLKLLCQGASIKKPLRLRFEDGKCQYLQALTDKWCSYIKNDAHLF